MNLSEFVKNPYTENAYFDFEDFADSIQIAVEALDTIIDENLDRHALKEQKENSKNYRNIGLGVCGYANMLFKLGIKYGSDKALDFTDWLFEFLFSISCATSISLVLRKGAFPKCKKDIIANSTILNNLEREEELKKAIKELGIRNCSLVSIAPTGSIATMLGVSGGCEPEFALSYTRKTDNLKDSYEIYCKSVEEYWKITGCKEKDINSLPDYFVTSKELNWKERIDTQAVMQKYVDTAISSTVNLPKETTLEQIEKLYLYAWEKGLKGITIYRDGCKKEGILTTENNKNEEKSIDKNTDIKLKRGEVISIDDENAIGFKRKLITGCGSLHCAAYFDINTGDLVETYLSKGSTGGCNNFMVGLSRMISVAARGGVPIQDIIDQLMSTGSCPSYATRSATKHDTSKGSCCPMAVGYALKEMWEEFQGKEMKSKEQKKEPKIKTTYAMKNDKPLLEFTYAACPECGEMLTFEGGCNICKSCGWSKCD